MNDIFNGPENQNRGPFVVTADGKMSDRDIWAAEMNPDLEKKFDNYMLLKAINAAATEELKRRGLDVD
jgi:hypothetical protein